MYKDNLRSYEFTFLYLINKCILSFKYIQNNKQKEILSEIKLFISKIQDYFSKIDFKNDIDKKNKILELLIDYLQKIIEEKIYVLINSYNKNNIISNIEKESLIICEKMNEKKINLIENNFENNFENNDKNFFPKTNNNIFNEKISKNEDQKKLNNNLIIEKINSLEEKINSKIKLIFSEIELNVKNSLIKYIKNYDNIENNLNQKFEIKIKENNFLIENKIKDILKNFLENKLSLSDINYQVNDILKDQINEIYNFLDNKIKEINTSNNNLFENKFRLLGNIFNENIDNILNNLSNRIKNNENDLINLIENKINNSNFNKNNFNIIYDKESNEIKLLYQDNIITSTKINIKGLIGPKGPQGIKGDNGITPIIRKIQFSEQNKIKFIFQEGNNIYEIISDNPIPNGPQGPQGIRGDPGKSFLDLKWNQDNVMRIDDDHKDSLIFLKSLCIGDKSHCLKNNSISVGGGLCYQNNSISVGNNSKTLDSESIAFFGSCIGKNSFAYRANNVDENNIEFGLKNKNNYNINQFNVNSKEINLDCDILKIKANKYENNKIIELQEKINILEKKIIDIYKKI